MCTNFSVLLNSTPDYGFLQFCLFQSIRHISTMMNTASLGNFLISRAPPPQLYHLPVLAAWAGSFPSHRNPRPYHHLVWCSLDKALPPLLKTFSTAGLPAKDTAAAAIRATPGWASGSVDAATAPAILQEGGAVQHMVVLDAMALLYRAHFARRGARVQMPSSASCAACSCC